MPDILQIVHDREELDRMTSIKWYSKQCHKLCPVIICDGMCALEDLLQKICLSLCVCVERKTSLIVLSCLRGKENNIMLSHNVWIEKNEYYGNILATIRRCDIYSGDVTIIDMSCDSNVDSELHDARDDKLNLNLGMLLIGGAENIDYLKIMDEMVNYDYDDIDGTAINVVYDRPTEVTGKHEDSYIYNIDDSSWLLSSGLCLDDQYRDKKLFLMGHDGEIAANDLGQLRSIGTLSEVEHETELDTSCTGVLLSMVKRINPEGAMCHPAYIWPTISACKYDLIDSALSAFPIRRTDESKLFTFRYDPAVTKFTRKDNFGYVATKDKDDMKWELEPGLILGDDPTCPHKRYDVYVYAKPSKPVYFKGAIVRSSNYWITPGHALIGSLNMHYAPYGHQDYYDRPCMMCMSHVVKHVLCVDFDILRGVDIDNVFTNRVPGSAGSSMRGHLLAIHLLERSYGKLIQKFGDTTLSLANNVKSVRRTGQQQQQQQQQKNRDHEFSASSAPLSLQLAIGAMSCCCGADVVPTTI